ncbi:phosphocholine cytidylyltransferase family protein [Bacillus ndiopicus]|uniref:phosphocholine cytidylyltransferase family protein n=1 Tax=Bacillus ndiopicus TaxID=1347368 RepID=UPI0005AB8F00|nr:NTP transferase domain-containing protein [Bacillus ndiopicus]
MKTVVIVAAGLSSRLYPLTKTSPKCLLPLGTENILQRNLRLLENNGFERIIIITGYLKEMIEHTVESRAVTLFNPFYKFCNNMGSLYFAKNLVGREPFLYLHGDVVFSELLLQQFLNNIDEQHFIDLAVDFKEADEEAMKVQINEEFYLIRSSKDITLEDSKGEWIGLAAIHRPEKLFKEIEKQLVAENMNVYDTYAFTELAKNDERIKCLPIYDEPWVEVDFIEDYEKAKELFE